MDMLTENKQKRRDWFMRISAFVKLPHYNAQTEGPKSIFTHSKAIEHVSNVEFV